MSTQKIMKRSLLLTVFSLIAFSLIFTANVMAVDPPMQEIDGDTVVNNSYQAGAMNQFRFRNQFQFQLQMNNSGAYDIESTSENGKSVGERSLELQVETTFEAKLTVKVMSEDDKLQLNDGAKIQTKSQNRLQYREQFMVNLTLNGTGQPEYARLALETSDSGATWAYYDETEEQWVEVASSYQDGQLICEVDHFTVFTVLSEESSISSFPLVALSIGSIGMIGILMKKRTN